MPAHRFDVNRKLLARSDRVKSVDIHTSEPWLLAALYNGNVLIYNFETQALLKTIEVGYGFKRKLKIKKTLTEKS